MAQKAPPARRPGLKNVTPPRGSTPEKEPEYKPRFKSDKPQPRTAQGGRGNERVTNDDVSRVAEQATTTRWDRLPNAVEYLRRFIDSKEFPVTGEQASQLIPLLIECLRRYVQHIETLARNDKKDLTPQQAMKLMNLIYKFTKLVGENVKSPAEKVHDILRFTVVPEIFSDNDTTSLVLEGIGRCNIMDDISLVVNGESKEEKDANRQALYQWFIESGFEDLLTQTINAQSMAAWYRKQLQEKDGVLPPADLVTVKPITRAQITRV